MGEKQNDGKRAHTLNVRSLTRLRHQNPNSLRFFFHFFLSISVFLFLFRFFCRWRWGGSSSSKRSGAYVKEHANRAQSLVSEVCRLCQPIEWVSECYRYAETEPASYVCHNHSEYFIDISDHSDRFTDSLFFRSLRWIDVSGQLESNTIVQFIHLHIHSTIPRLVCNRDRSIGP